MERERENILLKILDTCKDYSKCQSFFIEGVSYSYADLMSRVRGIYSLIESSACQEVGIVGENRIETYASVLATLLSGKTYVILHPLYPAARNRKIADASGIQLLLYAGDGLSDECCSNNVRKQCTVGINNENLSLISRDSVASIQQTNNAYIMFTSGSTGEPKGVPISYSNLNAFYNAYKELGWQLDETDRMLQVFELTFDLSVVSTLYPLTIGASVYTVGQGDMKYTKVFELLEEEHLTFAAVPSSLLQFLSPYFNEINLPELKYVGLAAEAAYVTLIERFMKCAPNAKFFDLYGPTETTIYCTSYPIPANGCKHHNGMISIGKPFKGIQVLLRDENGKMIPEGEEGELWVSGEQVMKGYWHDEKRSAEVLVNVDGTIYYKTGDLCKFDADGDIIYCGRKDSQVKIQGFRVELSEIEYAAKHFYADAVAVVAIPLYDAERNCTIHLVVESSDKQTASLLDYLKTYLPSYMMPKQIHFMDKFPLNASNKIDRKLIATTIH